MGFSIIQTGIEKVRAALRRTPSVVQDDAAQFMVAKASEFVGLAKEYPPETEANRPPPPFYTRTNTLKDGWSSKNTGTKVLIENQTPYLPWVHGTYKQAWFHKARGWKTIKAFLDAIGLSGDEVGDYIIVSSKPVAKVVRTGVINRIRQLFS